MLSAVKIGKQYLQTASASGGLDFVSQTPYRGFAPGPGEFSPRRHEL